MEKMKIFKLIVPDYRQFKSFIVDLRYPDNHPDASKAGKPLEKVCFIGSNGTGKSTILQMLFRFLANIDATRNDDLIVGILVDDVPYYIQSNRRHPTRISVYTNVKNEEDFVENILALHKDRPQGILSNYRLKDSDALSFISKYKLATPHDILINSEAESQNNLYLGISDVPVTTLDEALKLFTSFPVVHIVSADTVKSFWKLLIYQIKKRENDYYEYQNKEENESKTVKQLKEEFDKMFPKILEELATLWNRILDKANLKFDVKSATNPIQLQDNLKAYITSKSNGTRISYNALSTGIRNFIFKVGHIYSLYFNRDIQRGFLLIDEPENSLFPDLLYEMIDIYRTITKNTQIFMSTHSPIIAAQFDPAERIILEFNETGNVSCRRGVMPEGDDPNDLLVRDFGVQSILGKEGLKKWQRYIELKILIPNEADVAQKSALLDEYMSIGNAYNFEGDVVSK